MSIMKELQSLLIFIFAASCLIQLVAEAKSDRCNNNETHCHKEDDDDVDQEPYLEKLRDVINSVTRFPEEGPDAILDWLIIGAREDALNLDWIKSAGITHVINTAPNRVNTGKKFYGKKIKYVEFKARDRPTYNMMQHYWDAHKMIEDARKKDGKVLLHCKMGRNRSGVLGMAYYMMHKKIGPITAAEEVLKKRAGMVHNTSFQQQLIEFAAEQGLLTKDRKKL